MLNRLFTFLTLWLFVVAAFAATNDKHASAKHAPVPTTASAAFDANGKLYVVIPRDDFIWLKTSNDFGKTFSEEIKVNALPEKAYADGDNRPKIAALNTNELVITYTQPLEKPWTGHIRLIRSNDGAKTFHPPITVNDNQDIISHRFDSLLTGNGKVWVTWLDKRDLVIAEKEGKPYEGSALYYAESDDGGKTFKLNVKLFDNSCECCRIAMALDNDGVPVIFWRHVFPGDIRDHAMVKLDGKSQLIRVSHDQWQIKACPHHGPGFSIGPNGVYHFTWFTQANDQPALLYSRSEDKGKHFSKPLSVGSKEIQIGHSVVLSLGKQVFLAWKEFDGKQTSIKLMRSTNAGKTWSKARIAGSSIGPSDHPLLIAYKNKPFLSWYTATEGYRLIPI